MQTCCLGAAVIGMVLLVESWCLAIFSGNADAMPAVSLTVTLDAVLEEVLLCGKKCIEYQLSISSDDSVRRQRGGGSGGLHDGGDSGRGAGGGASL